MTSREFAVFDTALGRCGIAWGGRGVVAVQLPEAHDAATRARLLQRCPDAREASPPPAVAQTLSGIVALLRGETHDFSAVVLDMEGVPPFHRRVYEVARRIPPGATCSYGELAAHLGTPQGARAVGQALRRNPFAIVVPCHRVVAAGDRIGGFSANGGIATKLRLLSIERAAFGTSSNTEPTPAASGDAAFGFEPRRAVEHLRSADSTLARLIDAIGPFRMEVKQTSNIFNALAEAIVYQQLTGKAAATIFARVCALFPRPQGGLTAAQILRATDEKLRGAGLSRAKLLALRDLAQRAVGGGLPTLQDIQHMDDEAIIASLTAVRGIGRWTVEMLLMFRLGRPDVLPVDDYGIRKGFAIAFATDELPGRADLEQHGERWKPYRTVASWYLWRAVEKAALRAGT